MQGCWVGPSPVLYPAYPATFFLCEKEEARNGNHCPLNQIKANQNEPKQNQSYDHPKEEVKENGNVKNGSFLHRPSMKQFLCLGVSKPPLVSIVEIAQQFMATQIRSFETPIFIRGNPKEKRFSKKFQITSPGI
jgi:hypothetical protein